MRSGQTQTRSFGYDALDRVVSTTYPDGEVVATGYNLQGLPETLKNNDTPSCEYVDGALYNALGQMTLLTFGGAGLALQTKYEYYPDDQRLQRLRVGIPDTPGRDLNLTYTYDAGGNVTQINDRRWVNELQVQQLQIFGYDALDRLSSAYTSGAGTWGTYNETYQYNALGNPSLHSGQA